MFIRDNGFTAQLLLIHGLLYLITNETEMIYSKTYDVSNLIKKK